jgi:hypothetical protein
MGRILEQRGAVDEATPFFVAAAEGGLAAGFIGLGERCERQNDDVQAEQPTSGRQRWRRWLRRGPTP